MAWFDTLGYGMDIWQIVRWIIGVVVISAGSAGGAWIAFKRWLLPKEMVAMHDKLDSMGAELQRVSGELAERKAHLKDLAEGTSSQDYEQGYEVLNWWGETGEIKTPIQQLTASITKDLIGGRKKYPRTILVRKTGQIKELPYPPTANKIPDDDG